MLLDPRNESTEQEKGFNPKVQNAQRNAKASGGQKFAYWFIVIITLGLFIFFYDFPKKNYFQEQQETINESISGIDVQLAKRRDTLIQMFDAVSQFMKFEKSYITEVTKLRNVNITNENRNQVEKMSNDAFSRLLVANEQYPQIQSSRQVQELIQTAEYLQKEIAASRRIYNSNVGDFNRAIVSFPGVIVATKMKLYSMPLFIASSDERKDVSFKNLGN